MYSWAFFSKKCGKEKQDGSAIFCFRKIYKIHRKVAELKKNGVSFGYLPDLQYLCNRL